MGAAFETAVELQLQRLQQTNLHAFEVEVAEKRRAWLRQRGVKGHVGRTSPRDAYELFFRDYLGIPLTEAPVTSESDDEIVWRSVNPCPTLEACARLGLDTRKVCRAVCERSTQAFLSELDPELRFHRSYVEIRPHAPYCEERIVRVDFEGLMGVAIIRARRRRAVGSAGHSAVVFFAGAMLAIAHDAADDDAPHRHADTAAIGAACARLDDTDLTGAILLSTREPCPLCFDRAIEAKLTSIVFGVSHDEQGRLDPTRVETATKDAAAPAMVEVIGGVRREECLALCS